MKNQLSRILASDKPGEALRLMHLTGELKDFLPEVDALYGVPQRAEFHPEIDAGWHMELVMDQAVRIRANPSVKIAALLHDLGKGITPAEILPRHTDHDKAGVPLVKAVCERLTIDRYTTELALAVCEHHIRLYTIFDMKPTTIVDFVNDVFRWKDFQFAVDFVSSCQCDSFGRLGKGDKKLFHEGLLLLSCIRGLNEYWASMSEHRNEHEERHECMAVVRQVCDKYSEGKLDI